MEDGGMEDGGGEEGTKENGDKGDRENGRCARDLIIKCIIAIYERSIILV